MLLSIDSPGQNRDTVSKSQTQDNVLKRESQSKKTSNKEKTRELLF